jgi:hypothetical protein
MDYTKEEAEQRLVAALRGARLAGHMPMKAKKAAKKREVSKPAPRSRSRQKINK